MFLRADNVRNSTDVSDQPKVNGHGIKWVKEDIHRKHCFDQGSHSKKMLPFGHFPKWP